MFPFNIPIGSHHIPVHFICEVLAYSIGYRYYAYLKGAGNDLISNQHRLMIFLGAAAGAFLGSHLLGILENPLLLPYANWRYIMANTTIVGGLLGGLAGVELVKKQIGVTVSSGDLMVYPIILSMIIGRTGCFLAGLEDGTYGIASSLPWAINFGDGIPRHPTNLYEVLFWIGLCIGLRLFENKYQFSNGSRFKILMVAYLMFRILIESIKPVYFFNFGLSSIQLACLAGLVYYYKVFIYPSKLIVQHA